MAHKRGQSFLLETAAGDLTRLVESSLENAPRLTDDLLTIVLDLDLRDPQRNAGREPARRAQGAAAARDAVLACATTRRGHDGSAATWPASGCPACCGLKKELESETRPHYWEFTERGLNFAYLAPDRRARLDEVFRWIEDEASRTN